MSAYLFLDGLRITSQAPTCFVVEQQRQFAVPQERSRRLSQSSGLYLSYTINNSPVRNFLNAFPWWTERAVLIRGGLLLLLNKPWREEQEEEKSARLQECKKHRLQIVCRTNVWSRASHSLPFESRERVKIMCGRCQKEQVWLRKRGRSTTTMAGAKGGGGKRKRKRWSDRRAVRRWRGAMQNERGRVEKWKEDGREDGLDFARVEEINKKRSEKQSERASRAPSLPSSPAVKFLHCLPPSRCLSGLGQYTPRNKPPSVPLSSYTVRKTAGPLWNNRSGVSWRSWNTLQPVRFTRARWCFWTSQPSS